MPAKPKWPPWWDWDLVFTDYSEARMEERLCTEVDVRRTMEYASDVYRGKREGRWVIESRFLHNPAKVIVEPDPERKLLVVVTPHPVETMK